MKIKSITPAGREAVYNMTVDEFHNYIIKGGVVLKNCDAMRYFCITRTLGAQKAEAQPYEFEQFNRVDYNNEMTGGEMSESYLTYGGR